MAKSYKDATKICLILTGVSIAGIAAGVFLKQPLVIAAVMLPTVVYEIYRTEGMATKFASLAMLIVLIAEAYMIIKKPVIDFSAKAGKISGVVDTSFLKSLDAVTLGPAVIAALAFFLIRRTGGKYTIWLAVIILVTSLGLIYTVNPLFFDKLLDIGIDQVR